MADVAAPAAVRIVKISSSDNEEFLLPRNICALSKTLDNILRDLGLDDAEETNKDAIPVKNVDAKTLRKVLDWAENRLNNPAPAPVAENQNVPLSEFEVEYFKVSQTTVFEIILAANYLDIPELLDAGCQAVANLMKGLTVEQMRKQFEIVNDFTAAEEAEIRRENAWCEE